MTDATHGLAGRLLAGRFEVLGAAIGSGATGVVYPAVDRTTGRAVAIKRLHPHLVADPDALERLRAEAGIAGRLQHEHVVQVLGLWADVEGWLVVSERVDGQSLEELKGAMAPAAVAALGLQIADALDAVHRRGIVHGDVRPGNVLLGPRGACLFDFGLASLAREGGVPLLEPGETAPEVLSGAPPLPAADLYGLGVVLHRALTGELPFQGPTAWASIGAQREGPPAVAGPRGLACLVRELLHPDPSRRPPDAAAVRSALRALLKRPHRPVRVTRRWLAPMRLRGPWLVHGVDPRTGSPAVVRRGLSRASARTLVERLRAEGWSVRRDQEALGWPDLLSAAVLAFICGVALPVVGAPFGLIVGLRLRSGRCRPELADALPTVSAPVPPRRAPPGNESTVLAGLLLLLVAVALAGSPALAPIPVGALVVLAWYGSRGRDRDELANARVAHVQAELEEVRRRLERSDGDLDHGLALLGELQELERAWTIGELPDRYFLTALQAVGRRAAPAEEDVRERAGRTVEALRRVTRELDNSEESGG